MTNTNFKQVQHFSWNGSDKDGEDQLNDFLMKMGNRVIDIQYQHSPLGSDVLVTFMVIIE